MIRNEYRVTWEIFRSWMWENKRKPPRLVFTIVWVLFGIAVTWLAAAYRFAPYLVMTFFCLYRAFLRDILAAKRQYGAMAKSYGQKDWLRSITFDEEQITLKEGNLSVNYRYSDISGIREAGNRVWLTLKDGKVIRLYKDCFVGSDWEGCRELTARKCGSLLQPEG